MNHTTTSIRIIIAIALSASMVVAGVSLPSLQQQRGYAASEAQKHEQSTILVSADNKIFKVR
jgi:Flp pilus assembly protein CpaB